MITNTLLAYFRTLLKTSDSGVVALDSSYDNVVLRAGDVVIRVSLNKPAEDVAQEAQFIKYLHDKHAKVAEVVENNIVELPEPEKALPYLTTKYIQHTPHSDISDTLIKEAATQLYLIHSYGQQYCETVQYFQKRHISELLDRFISKLDDGMSPNAINRSQVETDARWASSFIRAKSDTTAPLTILHNDYRPQNVLTNESGLMAVIDFDYSISTRTPQKDVAHAALEWSFPDTADAPDMRVFELFVSTYASHFDQSYEQYVEQTKLMDWVKASAMIDAAGFYLHNPENTEQRFGSYMYKKYKYFQAL